MCKEGVASRTNPFQPIHNNVPNHPRFGDLRGRRVRRHMHTDKGVRAERRSVCACICVRARERERGRRRRGGRSIITYCTTVSHSHLKESGLGVRALGPSVRRNKNELAATTLGNITHSKVLKIDSIHHSTFLAVCLEFNSPGGGPQRVTDP
jgi:hypothetical protein